MSTFIRLTDYKSSDEKEKGFFDSKNRYEAKQEDFEKIPGSPIAYWVSDKVKALFEYKSLSDFNKFSNGLNTGDNDRFLRFWSEIEKTSMRVKTNNFEEALESKKRWFPYNKGGSFKKWYGNDENVIFWDNNGFEIKKYAIKRNKGSHWSRYLCGMDYQFHKSITWSFVSSSKFGIRFKDNGYLFDVGGSSMFVEDNNYYKYFGALLNTKLAFFILKNINPTLNFQTGNIGKIPLVITESEKIKQQIDTLTQECIDISKEEWDSRETSWDFAQNELLRILHDEFLILDEKMQTLEMVYNRYCDYWSEKFYRLHANEEELNRLFIDIYELQDELTPDVALEDITILKNEAKIVNGKLVFDKKEIMKQFVSYGVGVMFGRYSLDHKGLHIANMNESLEDANAKFNIQHPTFEADDDNIIPIVDESDYFSDDMTERFIEFVRTTFGSEKLQQNIAFIEAGLGKKLRAYFLKDFYTDHTKRYKKRPIYWLFSSPKGTFKALIYMHRYTPDTLNNILNDYLRPFRIRLDTMRNEALRVTESEDVSARDKTQADKRIDKIDKTLSDINEYEKILAHYAAQRIEIDLDDGVKVNYCKFQEVLFQFDKKLCK